MIKETIKADSEKLIITIPKEYIGKNLEILIFSNDEIFNNTLNRFENLVKKRVKPNINYQIGMENEVNNDLFWY